jgi:hypothetical protein
MRVVILYRPNSEYSLTVEDFIRNYQIYHDDQPLEVLNIDTRDGSATAALYDVVEYPAILVLQSDGYLQKLWQGSALPRVDDVIAYAHV